MYKKKTFVNAIIFHKIPGVPTLSAMTVLLLQMLYRKHFGDFATHTCTLDLDVRAIGFSRQSQK